MAYFNCEGGVPDMSKDICDAISGKAGQVLYDAYCHKCKNNHGHWKYPCKSCTEGHVQVPTIYGFALGKCDICEGRGYLDESK